MQNDCASCRHWSPKAGKEMAKHRMCCCALGPKWRYYPPKHTCVQHVIAAADVIASRAEWIGKHFEIKRVTA